MLLLLRLCILELDAINDIIWYCKAMALVGKCNYIIIIVIINRLIHTFIHLPVMRLNLSCWSSGVALATSVASANNWYAATASLSEEGLVDYIREK
jgi:hypothetical protein